MQEERSYELKKELTTDGDEPDRSGRKAGIRFSKFSQLAPAFLRDRGRRKLVFSAELNSPKRL